MTYGRWPWLSLFLLGVAACGGSVGTVEDGPRTTDPVAPPGDAPGPTPVRPNPPIPPHGPCDESARTLASGEGIPSDIAVDERYVYWLTHAGAADQGGTNLRAVDKCRRSNPITLATAPYFASGLSVDARGVYFSTTRGDGQGSIGMLPKQPGQDGAWTFGALRTWTGSFNPGDVRAGLPGSLYWVETEAGIVAAIGKANERITLVSGLDHPTRLAFDGRRMLVSASTGLYDITTSPPTRVVSGDIRALTATPSNGAVYALTTNTAYRIERDKNPSVLLASFPTDVDDIAANSIDLFFAHGLVVDIGAFPVGGGPTTQPMNTGGKGPGRVAADDAGIYFTAGGAIGRAKNARGM